jgi:hypothetical protein
MAFDVGNVEAGKSIVASQMRGAHLALAMQNAGITPAAESIKGYINKVESADVVNGKLSEKDLDAAKTSPKFNVVSGNAKHTIPSKPENQNQR